MASLALVSVTLLCGVMMSRAVKLLTMRLMEGSLLSVLTILVGAVLMLTAIFVASRLGIRLNNGFVFVVISLPVMMGMQVGKTKALELLARRQKGAG
jgi:hypothetical protein